MGKIHGFAETTAIADRVGKRQIQRKRRHDKHREKKQDRRYPPVRAEKRIYPQHQFIHAYTYSQKKRYGHYVFELERRQILPYLQRRTHRIDRLDKSRKDKCRTDNQPCQYDKRRLYVSQPQGTCRSIHHIRSLSIRKENNLSYPYNWHLRLPKLA